MENRTLLTFLKLSSLLLLMLAMCVPLVWRKQPDLFIGLFLCHKTWNGSRVQNASYVKLWLTYLLLVGSGCAVMSVNVTNVMWFCVVCIIHQKLIYVKQFKLHWRFIRNVVCYKRLHTVPVSTCGNVLIQVMSKIQAGRSNVVVLLEAGGRGGAAISSFMVHYNQMCWL